MIRNIIVRDIKLLLKSLLVVAFMSFLLGILRIFERGMFLFLQLLVVAFLTLILLYFLSELTKITMFFKQELASVCIAFFVFSFLVLNIDRSRSVYLLKWVQQTSVSGQTDANRIIEFKQLTPIDARAIEMRIGEQVQTGFLVKDGDNISLTPIGRFFLQIAKGISTLFHLEGYKNS